MAKTPQKSFVMLLLPTDKRAARAYLSEKRNAIPALDVSAKSQIICDRLLNAVLSVDADDILLFSPIGSEPDLLPLAQRLISLGKRVYFPISQKDTVRLDFRAVASLDELAHGAYGIKEPPCQNTPFDGSARAVCVVPALSFDTSGMRIGYGKGYYDRFLSNFSGLSIGVTFASLVAERVPTDKYDVPVDVIITEEGVTVVNEAKKSLFFWQDRG